MLLKLKIFAPVTRLSSLHTSTRVFIFGSFCVLLLAIAGIARAAMPFTSATVTKVENEVLYGSRSGGSSSTRPASVMDVVYESNFLLTKMESRAELQYPDGSVIRVGQNAVFTFDAASRTLSLEKGSLLFHIPKGSGGGTIKTPTLTAALTGTAGKVTTNIIAIVDGSVALVPSGRVVRAGEFARHNADGSVTIAKFDPETTLEGKLIYFNGLMPGFDDTSLVNSLFMPDLHYWESLERTQNLPSSIGHFFPPHSTRPAPVVPKPRPTIKPVTTPRPIIATPPPMATPPLRGTPPVKNPLK